jgi:hypothetical protein
MTSDLVRRRLVTVAALALSLLATTTAGAHNGVGASFTGHAGRYLVYAYDADALSDTRLEYHLVLLNGRTKNPVYDVTTTVRGSLSGDAAGDVPATARGEVTTFGNVAFFTLPNPYPGHWVVSLSLAGRLGKGTTTFRAHGLAPTGDGATVVDDDGGSSATPWVVAGVGGAAVIGLIAWMLRRRSPEPPPLP